MTLPRLGTVIFMLVCLLAVVPARAQTPTTFTYQGRIVNNGSPYTGSADVQLTLYDAPTTGNKLAATVTLANVAVNQGVFSAGVDFGNVFRAGTVGWVEASVRTPAGSGNYQMLTPRQPINPVPLAQGLTGVNITPGGNETLDQDQSAGQSANFNTSLNAYQSFTPTRTGAMTRLELSMSTFAGSAPLTVNIRSGVGKSGPILGTLSIPTIDGVSSTPVTGVFLQAGQPYTLDFVGTSGLQNSSTTIPGASGSWNGISLNFWFKLSITPIPTIGAYSTLGFLPVATGGLAYAGGNVGIGTATPATTLDVKGNGGLLNLQGTDHAYIQFYPKGIAGGRKAYIGVPSANSVDFNIVNENTGFLNLTGTLVRVTGAFLNNSDARDKHDVRDIDDPLSLVTNLHGVRYHFNERSLAGSPLPAGEQIGFLAQDVQRVLPELVAGDDAGSLGVSYVSLVPVLTEAIKQQQAIIQDLREQNDRTNMRLAEIEALLKSRVP